MEGQEAGYPDKPARRVRDFVDFGVSAGLAVFCLFTQAGVIPSVGAGVAAVGWFLLRPIGRIFGGKRGPDVPTNAVGLNGGEPSARPLAPLIFADLRGYLWPAFGLACLTAVLYGPVASNMPSTLPFLYPAGLLAFVVYVWSRVSRLQRLCRTGTEVEARLVGVETDRERQKIAKYVYSFRGRTGQVTNTSWLGERAAVRHGERIVVLLDPHKPDDAVILGRLPNT